MTSTEKATQIEEMAQRRADIVAQQDAAQTELKAQQKSFAHGKAKVEVVTQAQAQVSGIGGALELLDEDMRAAQIEYSIAIADETRAAQLADLKNKVENANATWQAYGAAQIQALQQIENAAKSLLETFNRHDAVHTATAKFLQQPETVVSLRDLDSDIDTTSVTVKLPFLGAPINGETIPGENVVYLRALHGLMTFLANSGEGLRPCPHR